MGGGGLSTKHKAQAQILDMLRTWQADLSYVKVSELKERNKEGKSNSGKDSNPQPGKWPAMI